MSSTADPVSPSCVVGVGASAGGVDALRSFVSGFDDGFPGSVLAVLHLPPTAGSALDRILERSTEMRTAPARDGERLEPGRVYVARPDHHLIVQDGVVRLSHGPRENGVRPAIDPLFRSLARWYRDRAVGVVLSGTGDDGTAGLAVIKAQGGMALVQAPSDATYRDMPTSAMQAVDVDMLAPAGDLAAAIVDALGRSGRQEKVRTMGQNRDEPVDEGPPSAFTCPDCGGTLFERRDGSVDRYACRVGHVYSSETLLDRQDENLENVLWSAVRALEERADLARRISDRLRGRGYVGAAERYVSRIEESEDNARRLRAALLASRPLEHADEAEEA